MLTTLCCGVSKYSVLMLDALAPINNDFPRNGPKVDKAIQWS